MGWGADALRSTDGITWEHIRIPSNSNWHVAFGAGIFAAAGLYMPPPKFLSSPDGETWTVRAEDPTTNNRLGGAWWSIAYGEGAFAFESTATGFVGEPTAYYGTSEQIIDGRTIGAPIYAKVFQLSAIAGRGYPCAAVFP
jgi:hypothetical protein